MIHTAAATLFWGIVLLALFLWYLGTIDKARKKLIGTILTVIMSLFCFWAFDGQNLFLGKPLNIHLGIDMAGGSSFTVRLQPGKDDKGKDLPVTKADVDHAITILMERLSPGGTKDVQIAAVGDDNRINIQMPGVTPEEIEGVRTKITQIAHLEFRLVDPNNEADLGRVASGGVPPIGYESLEYADKDEANAGAKKKDEKPKAPTRKIFVSQRTELDGSHVTRAANGADPNRGYVINLEFDSEGARLFDEAAVKGYTMMSQAGHTGEDRAPRLAIVVDNVVISAPTLQTMHFGGRAEISGNFTQESSAALATALKNPLRNPMQIMEENTVSPAYGASTIKQGIYTGVVGSLIVAVFMVFYYRFAGLIALVGLFVDFLIMFGTMSLFGFTLTMPGVAGMVLTIGMAVDANVLIYERMREELKSGKSLIAALDTAFEKAFPAIFDAHVTALITSLILFYLASGLVKGFAVTMLVGIVGTLFGALIVTRVVFHWFTDSGKLSTLKVHHLIPDRIYDMLSYSKPFIIGSFTLAALSVGVFAIKGPKAIGIDFRGGALTRVELKEGQNLSDDEVTAALKGLTMKVKQADNTEKEVPIGDYFIQHAQTTTGNLVTVRSEYEAGVPVRDALDKKFHDRIKGDEGKKAEEISRVGSLVGSELAKNSSLAYIVAMVTIFIYLVARYELAFAIGAIVALFHDCLIVIGLSVAFGQELSLVHIGAVLTVAGYSINDTIIVFDRIREMIRTKSGRIRDIMNEAISITLSRTLLTSLTAFMPMMALFIFGGPAMREFALPILIGIIVGTYSSIYIASPIVLWYAKRTGQSLRRQVLDSAAASESAKQIKPIGA